MKITKVETLGGKIVCRVTVIDDWGRKGFAEKIGIPYSMTKPSMFENLSIGDEVLLECEEIYVEPSPDIHCNRGGFIYQLKLTDGLVTVVEENKMGLTKEAKEIINGVINEQLASTKIEQLTKERDYYKKLSELLEDYYIEEDDDIYQQITQHKSNKP